MNGNSLRAALPTWSEGAWWWGTPRPVLSPTARHNILKAWSGKVLCNPIVAGPLLQPWGFCGKSLHHESLGNLQPLPPRTPISAYFNKDLIHNIGTWKQPFRRHFHTVLKSKQGGGWGVGVGGEEPEAIFKFLLNDWLAVLCEFLNLIFSNWKVSLGCERK